MCIRDSQMCYSHYYSIISITTLDQNNTRSIQTNHDTIQANISIMSDDEYEMFDEKQKIYLEEDKIYYQPHLISQLSEDALDDNSKLGAILALGDSKTFQIMGSEEIEFCRRSMVEKIAKDHDMSEGNAMLLLRHFNWELKPS
eukprot:TRINITY_DN2417_c0_g1_i2.p1 TRINITY_DN2417_c0_g1~~TRINITY_DN2417_c0_g1_i2.p1  ORF type:complete len:152 (+),score=28.66 TRINITY_DN2417_c0_g1_i2:28-456(+)